METQLPNPRKWFTRRRLVVFTCLALLAGITGGIWILRPSSLQREVEALGGLYLDHNLDFPSRISFSSWKRTTHAILQKVQGKSRQSISIGLHQKDVTDNWLRRNAKEMKRLPVHSLAFRGTKITDVAITHLAGMKTLAVLDLAGTSITDQSMSEIQKMPNLQLLDLANTRVTEVGISLLVDHPQLRHLDLNADALTDEAVIHLNAMPRLGSLGLKDFNNDHLRRLRGMNKLIALSLTGATDQALPSILQLSQIRYLSLVDSQLSAKSVETIRKTYPNLDIRQHMSLEKSTELGIPEFWAAQQRLKRNVFIAVALGGGCLILLIVMVLRRRQSRRQQAS